MFKIDFNPDKDNKNEERINLWGKTVDAIQQKMGIDILEFEVASYLEDELECQGICTPALFYYDYSIAHLRPE